MFYKLYCDLLIPYGKMYVWRCGDDIYPSDTELFGLFEFYLRSFGRDNFLRGYNSYRLVFIYYI